MVVVTQCATQLWDLQSKVLKYKTNPGY